MTHKTGCDIVFLPKFQRMVETTPSLIRTLFTEREQKNSSIEHLAGIFAAKESALKALSLKPGCWLDMEVRNETSGEPTIYLSPQLSSRVKDISVSISHDGDYVVAVVTGHVES